MDGPNDADDNEAAARRIQEQLWAEAEGGNDVDVGGGGGGAGDADVDDDNNDAGRVRDFVRQLLDRNNDEEEEDDDDDNAGDDNDNNNDAEEDDDDDDDDDDEDLAERRRGAVDGGIAGEVRDEHGAKVTRSLKCPLVLYFETDDELDELSPGNPVLKRGSTVYIGLDKNTRLNLVFDRYCKFVNSKSHRRGGKGPAAARADEVAVSDLEFLHCALLDAGQTVEASALMKNDRIKVHCERSRERAVCAEVLRQQRESDRKYFKDLRQLLPNPSPEGMGCDVVLDCRGKVVDERGYSQNVLATAVRANSVLISKRCKWLGRKIAEVREDARRRAEMTVPSEDTDERGISDGGGNDGEGEEREEYASGDGGLKSGQSDDEDDIIMADPAARMDDEDGSNNIAARGDGGPGSAAKVEDDEDEDPPAGSKVAKKASRKSAEGNSSSSPGTCPNTVWVTLDHSPQAVKLLLEYCYTNRVQSLGHEAFVKSSKYPNPKDVGVLVAKQAGPVPPFRKHEWPEGGAPTISLHLALAGIALAEEAHLPRLSHMCEVAATQLVNSKNVIDVLGACQVQQQRTGNRLPALRRAAMLDCIMASGSHGIDALYANPNFKNNLDERRGLVIPSLLDGTVEVMPTNMDTKEIRRKKERMVSDRKKMFDFNDNSDKNKRIMERLKWRDQATVARRMEVAYGPDERAFRFPPSSGKHIWRDSFRRDPPPAAAASFSSGAGGSSTGRGTKRKGGSVRAAGEGLGGAAAGGSARNVRRRQTRKRNNLA